MKSPISLFWVACILFFGVVPVRAQDLLKEQKPPTLMKYIINAAPEYACLVKSINAAQLTATLEGPGPMTLFAPENKAFALLPGGSVDYLLKPEMIDSLQKILTYHVVAGNWPLAELEQKIKDGGGQFSLPTIGPGGKLSFLLGPAGISVVDQHGSKMRLSPPIAVPNGIVYAIDQVLMP